MTAGPPPGGGVSGRLRRLPRRAWIAITGTATAASLGLALLVFTAVFISVAIPRASLGQRTRRSSVSSPRRPPRQRRYSAISLTPHST